MASKYNSYQTGKNGKYCQMEIWDPYNIDPKRKKGKDCQMEIWDPVKMIIKKGKTGKYFSKWKFGILIK